MYPAQFQCTLHVDCGDCAVYLQSTLYIVERPGGAKNFWARYFLGPKKAMNFWKVHYLALITSGGVYPGHWAYGV